MTKSLRKRYLINLSILITPLILIFLANYTISRNATGKTFNDVDQIEKNKVGLVLGTSEKLADGSINLYFKYRIQATVKLFSQALKKALCSYHYRIYIIIGTIKI